MTDTKPLNAKDDHEKLDRASDDQSHPLTQEQVLEEGLEDSMEGSDPLSITQPGDNGDPVPSSGYTDKDEAKV